MIGNIGAALFGAGAIGVLAGDRLFGWPVFLMGTAMMIAGGAA